MAAGRASCVLHQRHSGFARFAPVSCAVCHRWIAQSTVSSFDEDQGSDTPSTKSWIRTRQFPWSTRFEQPLFFTRDSYQRYAHQLLLPNRHATRPRVGFPFSSFKGNTVKTIAHIAGVGENLRLALSAGGLFTGMLGEITALLRSRSITAPEIAIPSTRGTGIGLRNVRDRLAQHYGDNATVAIKSRQSGGVTARREIDLAGWPPAKVRRVKIRPRRRADAIIGCRQCIVSIGLLVEHPVRVR